MLDKTDDTTLAQIAAKDVEAFAILYRRYVKQVYTYHLSRVGNIAEAEDLCSQTFLAALKNIRTYRGDGSFAGWLLRIAHYKTVDFYRQRQDEIGLDELEGFSPTGLSIDTLIDRRLQLNEVIAALKQINPERAEALRLRIFAGLSHAEIAEIMHKSEGAVKNLVYRAIADLKQYFSVEELLEDARA